MIARRTLTDHPSLSGADYVLEGATVRDRFLTAFVLQHNGTFFQSAWPHAARLPDSPPPPSLPASISEAEESFSVPVESAYEPLTVRVIEEWFAADDDDDL